MGLFRTGFQVFGFAAIAGSILLLVSCGPKLTAEHLAKIQTGMTSEEVKNLLGKPDDIHIEKALGFTGTTFTYHANSSDVKIMLVNERVVSSSGQIK
ncbi:MAG: hypothetical protein PHD76_03875 [Methylacidiphilales bacterium]|nr:hypothetical protein [Candidatus Methylacidiphilales bacterium]